MMAAGKQAEASLLSSAAFARFEPRIRQQADLSKTNWFRVGGPAEFLFKPESVADLSEFLALLPASVKVTVLGVGSNIIVRDGGMDGVVIKLGRAFAAVSHTGDTVLAGAAALDVNVANYAAEAGIAGLEFLSGIPGTIGGAVRMNAGAYGSDIAQVLTRVQIVERSGKTRWLAASECAFTYRHGGLPEGAIVVGAELKGVSGDSRAIAARIAEIAAAREATQPIRSRTGGSTFKNPEGHKAWALIDAAGCRGLSIGGAQVSEKHCNFLINTGEATAADLEALGEEVIKRVKAHSGITLEWEIKRIGKHAGRHL